MSPCLPLGQAWWHVLCQLVLSSQSINKELSSSLLVMPCQRQRTRGLKQVQIHCKKQKKLSKTKQTLYLSGEKNVYVNRKDMFLSLPWNLVFMLPLLQTACAWLAVHPCDLISTMAANPIALTQLSEIMENKSLVVWWQKVTTTRLTVMLNGAKRR